MHFVVPPMVRLFLAEKALAAAAFRLIERITAWRFNGRTRPALTPQGVHTDSSEAIFGAACFAPFHQTEALWKSRNHAYSSRQRFCDISYYYSGLCSFVKHNFSKTGRILSKESLHRGFLHAVFRPSAAKSASYSSQMGCLSIQRPNSSL